MLIDLSTVHSLELIQNLKDPKSPDCLFGLLDNTLTAMGARLLRASILQPLTDLSTLNARLDSVEEFTQHEEMFSQARQALKPVLDMDRLLTAVLLGLDFSFSFFFFRFLITIMRADHHSLLPCRSNLA